MRALSTCRSSRWRATAPLLLAALLAPALATDMLKMSEQLDQLDRMEMQEHLRKADGCIQKRDFACAEVALLKAKKLAKGSASLTEWTRTDRALADERDKVAQERAAALAAEQQRERERQRAAERLAAEQERERREEERLAAMERDSAEEAAPSAGAQIAAFGALVLQNYANNSAALRAQQLAQQQANEAARERQRLAAAERQQRVADERARLADERASRERRQLADASAEKSRAERAAAEQEERRRALAAEQTAQREREQRAEETRLRQEREKAERLAKQEADKAASRKELSDFHAGMLRGIRLAATKCPDGAGHYYATGSTPRIKEPVSAPACIDVAYEASCPDNRPPIRGVAKNFVGMSGCFGDTYQIDPKPSCDVKDVRVKVTSVESCS